MQAVAVGWLIYDITRNPLDLGLVGLVQFIPAVLFVLFAGHAADRYDRRIIIRVCQSVSGLAMAALAIGSAFGWLSRDTLLAIVFFTGAARAFEQTALATLLPGIVPVSLLSRATAASASAFQIAVIGGPAVGGLLTAISPVLVFALCCLLYIISSTVISMVTVERNASLRKPVSFAVLFAGFRYIWHNRLILGAISIDLFAVVVGSVYALLPVFARDVFHVDSSGLGILRASPGVGALVAAVLLAHRPPKQHVGRMIFAAVGAYAIAVIIFAMSTSFFLSMGLLAILGFSDMVSVVIRTTLIQLQTTDEVRGRVGAVNSLFVIASNQLGDFRAGLAASWIGTVPAVLVGGVGALMVVAVSRMMFSSMYRIEALETRR
jgi:MFS family permease